VCFVGAAKCREPCLFGVVDRVRSRSPVLLDIIVVIGRSLVRVGLTLSAGVHPFIRMNGW
jgi:hypothetical protein